MANITLLDYVQTIASSLDEDEVNSIGDTAVSLQIAHVVKTTWQSLQNRAELPEHFSTFELIASNDPTQPTVMYRPSDVDTIEWIQYDCARTDEDDPRFQRLTFLPLDEFLKRMYQLKPSDDNVGSYDLLIGTDTLSVFYKDNKAPQYFTTPNDSTILFDSYDVEVDDTLQKSKTVAYGHKHTDFTMADTFVPFQDTDMSTLLLNEAKVLAFAELKQVGHDVAKQWAQRGWTKLNHGKRGVDQNRDELSRAPDYSRKR